MSDRFKRSVRVMSRGATRHLMVTAGFAVLLSLAGCGRDPDLFTLASVSGPVSNSRPVFAYNACPSVVEVRTPVVSTALDRDEIVRANKDYQLDLARGDAWAQPLGEMIGRTLTLDLAQRLPQMSIIAQHDAVETQPQAFVEVTVTAFNEDQNGRAVVQGNLAVHGSKEGVSPVRTTPFYKTMVLRSRHTPQLVFALSQLTASLADDVALLLQNCSAFTAQQR